MNYPKRGSSFSWLLKITYSVAEFLPNSFSIDINRSYTVAEKSDIKGPQLRTFIEIPNGNTASLIPVPVKNSENHSLAY